MKNIVIILFGILLLIACGSSQSVTSDEKKCPYLEGQNE